MTRISVLRGFFIIVCFISNFIFAILNVITWRDWLMFQIGIGLIGVLADICDNQNKK